jgi:hypothetical protein
MVNCYLKVAQNVHIGNTASTINLDSPATRYYST